MGDAMRKQSIVERINAAFKIQSGYCYAYQGKRNWFASTDERWDIEVYTPTGEERVRGTRRIDEASCIVFACPDGKFRAQTRVSCEVQPFNATPLDVTQAQSARIELQTVQLKTDGEHTVISQPGYTFVGAEPGSVLYKKFGIE